MEQYFYYYHIWKRCKVSKNFCLCRDGFNGVGSICTLKRVSDVINWKLDFKVCWAPNYVEK